MILTTVTLATSNNALPDDGDCTETCRSCFNINFNVNFKIIFKTIQLCISWWIQNFVHLISLSQSAYVGLYIDWKDMQDVKNIKFVILNIWRLRRQFSNYITFSSGCNSCCEFGWSWIYISDPTQMWWQWCCSFLHPFQIDTDIVAGMSSLTVLPMLLPLYINYPIFGHYLNWFLESAFN
jgi:hypothetical protein